jgi:hypothetical protein
MSFGPIQIFAIGFPSNDRFEGRIVDELDRLREVGAIRVVDAMFVMNEGAEGDSVVMRVSDLSDEQREELAAVIGALVGLGAAGEEGAVAGAELGAEIAEERAEERALGLDDDAALAAVEELPEGTSALVIAIEHRWAIPLRDAVRDAGGLLLGERMLTPESLVAAGAQLAAP